MTGEGTMLGEIYWRLGLKSTLKQDVGENQKVIEDFGKTVDRETTQSETSFKKMGMEVSRTMTAGSRAVTGFGAGLVGLTVTARSLGVEMDGIEEPLLLVGGSMMALGGFTDMANRALRAYTTYQTSTAIPAMKAYAVAIWAAHGPLIAIAGVAAAATIAFVILTRETKEAATQFDTLEGRVTALNDSLKITRYYTDVWKSALDSANDKLRDQKMYVENLTGAYDEYKSILDELAGIPETLEDIEREKKALGLELLKMATPEGDVAAQMAIKQAEDQLRKESLEDRLSDLDKEKTDTITRQQDLMDRLLEIQTEYHVDSVAALEDKIKTEEELEASYYANSIQALKDYNSQMATERAESYQAEIAAYEVQFSEMRKKGIALTPEQKAKYMGYGPSREALLKEPEYLPAEFMGMPLSSIESFIQLLTPAGILGRAGAIPEQKWLSSMTGAKNPNYVDNSIRIDQIVVQNGQTTEQAINDISRAQALHLETLDAGYHT